jgi:periplasmic protein TonB
MKTNTAVSRSAMIPAAGLSLIFSLSLFGLMYSVIKAGHGVLEKKDALPTIDFVRLKRDTEVETLSRRKPPPPPPAPPPPQKMKIAGEAVARQGLGLEIPNLDLKADVGGELMGGKKGGGAGMFDGDIISLQCPPVAYPSDAKRAGITGWVQIELVVGPDGLVRSAKAVDAQPRGLFEAAAVMAAQRCKFKPKVVDGVPVEQRGRKKWNFNLNKAGEE